MKTVTIAERSFNVGHLTVAQCVAALALTRAAQSLTTGQVPEPDHLIATARFMASVLQAPATSADELNAWLMNLPLDVFINGVRAVFMAALESNTAYLTEKVGPAVEALTAVLTGLAGAQAGQ